ncbi:ComEC/Rec2 family competence protein [Mucilaginibacter auburnensis]|uniref:Competence protein ComEC n=1 Tax=Mucilaginibacter auburnensis TaxID=1457233 RepID=A0A2H9VVY6_9SPHI|nr:ComEC/Rec2 family competence protein [Mucilaginibacter auburnensis]PJJ84942.1 competence protein ComEC [Mucilaginibacter auburnensis]
MFANHKGEIPFVILLIPFIAGIGFAISFPNSQINHVITSILIALSIGYIALNFSYKYLSLYKQPLIGGASVYSILFLSGWVCAAQYNQFKSASHFSKHTNEQLVVSIANEPVIKNGYIRFAANVNEVVNNKQRSSVIGKLLVSIKDSAAFNLSYGDVLLITAKYNEVDPPFNPAEFNYKQYLANQNIYHQAYLYPKQYAVVGHNKGIPIIAYSLQLRQQLVNSFRKHMTDTSAIAVASTMILGYKADLSEDVLNAYTNTGTLHVLSVSGAHVAIVFMLLNWGLLFLNRFRYGKIIRALLIIALIWGYALLTGLSPAVNRAALMISLIIIGNNFYRYVNALNLLAASAFALLLYNPYYITDVGFQLSYLAIGGLTIFQPVLYKSFEFRNKWMDKLWSLCSFSIAAQLITFPLSAYYFHQFPVYFLLSNLFILLPVIVIMYVGFAFLVLSNIPYAGDALGFLLEKSIIIMNKGLALLEHLPFASLNKLWISKNDYLLLYGIIILFFYFLFNKNKRLLNWSLALIVVLAISLGWKKVDSSSTSGITFLNLKKNRGIVFKNGSNAVVLSDLKPDEKNYKYAIQPGLDSTKVVNVKTYSFAADFSLPLIRKKGNVIQFLDKNLLLLDSSTLITDNKVNIDYAYVSQNADIKVVENYSSKLLIINADNSNRYTDTIVRYLLKNNRKFYSLKRNKALNLPSN